MVVDGCVPRRSGERASLALRNVLQRARVAVALGEPKVNAEDDVSVALARVRDEVRRLDVAVDEVARVHELNALEHLVGHHEHRLEREAAAALVEVVLERRAQQVHDHEVVRVLRAEVVHLCESGRVLQLAVDLVLVAQLRAAGAVLLELDGHLLAVRAHAQVDIAEGPAAQALRDAVFGDAGLHGWL